MFIAKKAINRRAVLRGMGATLALPLLDAMVPALTAMAKTPGKPVQRFGIVYVPNGIAEMASKWTPIERGAGFELTTFLQPLRPHYNQLTVVSGLDLGIADIRSGERDGAHARAGTGFLTGCHARESEGANVYAGVSMDQIAARAFADETQLASLELSLESTEFGAVCDAGYACTYLNTLSWASPTAPLPMEYRPRVVFERLFGDDDSTDARARASRLAKNRSLLDSVREDVTRLSKVVGNRDRTKLNEYLESVRDVERRVQKAEQQAAVELPSFDRPVGVPQAFDEHAKLMFDLQVLAYQADLTRVITFMIAHEISGRAYPEVGAPLPHHSCSHHAGKADKIQMYGAIGAFHIQLFTYYLDRLRATPDGDGSLLDHVSILYGSGMGEGNVHQHHNLPILMVGGGAGTLKGGRHVVYPMNTVPMSNLHATILDNLGVHLDRFGDSTGKLSEIYSA